MKLKKIVRLVTIVLLFVSTAFAFPLNSLASGALPSVTIPESATQNNIPPASEISKNPRCAEGFSSNLLPSKGLALASSDTISGGCGFTKKTATTCTISGYSICTVSNPAISVAITIQAYYNGAWHNMHTQVKSVTGTYVSNSQGYTVTSGFYYRTRALHWLADGTSTTSRTSAVWMA